MNAPVTAPKPRITRLTVIQCEPYSCRLSAASCVARQVKARGKAGRAKAALHGVAGGVHDAAYGACRNCVAGEATAKALGVALGNSGHVSSRWGEANRERRAKYAARSKR